MLVLVLMLVLLVCTPVPGCCCAQCSMLARSNGVLVYHERIGWSVQYKLEKGEKKISLG